MLDGTGLGVRPTPGGTLLLVALDKQPPSAPAPGAVGNGEAPAALSEVIVTARKRPESLMNVPVVETVLTSERLDRLQTVDLKDIATLVPGVLIGDGPLAIGA